MSIAWLSSKRLICTKKYVHIYTVQDISNHINTTSSTSTHPHIHSTVKLCRKGVSQTNRESFSFSFLKMRFHIFLKRGERWRAADVCRKRVPDFSRLKVERSVSSRFEVSFGDFLLSKVVIAIFFSKTSNISRLFYGFTQLGQGAKTAAWRHNYSKRFVRCSLLFLFFFKFMLLFFLWFL